MRLDNLAGVRAGLPVRLDRPACAGTNLTQELQYLIRVANLVHLGF